MDFIWLKHLIPDVLQNNKDFLFGNIRELYEFHNRTFLKELEKCAENPELLAHCFLKRKEDLQIYFKYHKNLPRARAIWQECQDCAYFGVMLRRQTCSWKMFLCIKLLKKSKVGLGRGIWLWDLCLFEVSHTLKLHMKSFDTAFGLYGIGL